jgi:hypothetical protein
VKEGGETLGKRLTRFLILSSLSLLEVHSRSPLSTDPAMRSRSQMSTDPATRVDRIRMVALEFGVEAGRHHF